MLYLTKVEAKSPKSPVRKSNNSGPAPRERKTREREIPKKSHENERANITPKGAAEWMEKAGGDHMKAAEFWVQTEEKSKEPDPLLEKVKTYLEKTKGGSLDHRALELEMEEEEEEEERAEAAKQRKRTRARYLSTDLRGSEQQQPSAVEQTGHILEAREPASSASLQQYRLLSTSEAIPSHPPEKRRRTATDNLESDRK
ncbi:hypothetical protein GGR51DRAFT_302932 [Nemania sp. FL0031]|nr:hypothetical protein GGR51DRAFT_302932 [Nemania sp. FL0031]